MRIAVALLLSIALLAGCANPDKPDPIPEQTVLSAADIAVPEGAILQPIGGGFAAVWLDQARPFPVDVTLPAHATMVRAVAEAAGPVTMSNLETGRRRCNNPTVESFSDSFAG